MKTINPFYHRHRIPPVVIQHTVSLYHRFCRSYRDIEDLLSEHSIIVSYKTIRRWCNKFGPGYANRLRRQAGRCGDTWFVDEVFVCIGGRPKVSAVRKSAEVADFSWL